MHKSVRTTVYIKPRIFRAAKIKAATVSRSVSDLVNEALTLALREDALDLAAFAETRDEKTKTLEQVLKEMKRDGLL